MKTSVKIFEMVYCNVMNKHFKNSNQCFGKYVMQNLHLNVLLNICIVILCNACWWFLMFIIFGTWSYQCITKSLEDWYTFLFVIIAFYLKIYYLLIFCNLVKILPCIENINWIKTMIFKIQPHKSLQLSSWTSFSDMHFIICLGIEHSLGRQKEKEKRT